MWRYLLVALVVGAALWWGYTALQGEPVEAISAKWSASGHADATSRSFTLWDADDPSVVPVACAKCHSTPGFHDYLGEDGSTPGAVDAPAPTGSQVFCHACHNDAAHARDEVTFPSGVTVGEVGSEAVCMECHQGRRWTGDVDEATAGLPDDEVSEELAFIDVHYRIAAATQQGSVAHGGYEYAGREYVGRFQHMPDVRFCTDCHDPHSLAIDPRVCAPCHVNVVDRGDLRAIRTSPDDHDGDGDTSEGIDAEIEALRQALLAAIQRYAGEVLDAPIAYAPRSPYWVADLDGDGAARGDEVAGENRYAAWSPRLLRAAYNYHFSREDPGNYTHNARYVLQLLYDSTADLAAALGEEAPAGTRAGAYR